MAEQQQYVNDLACSSNTADILRASGAALQSFSAAETVVNSVVADNTVHPAAVHSVQYSQSVYGPNGQANYQPGTIGALQDYQSLSSYLNPDGTPIQNGRMLPSDSMLQQAYHAQESALMPRSPRRPYPDMLPPTAISPIRQPYAVAYEQVHVMFDPQQDSQQQQQQQVLLSTAPASVSLSPHVLPSAAAAARGSAQADASAVQQLPAAHAVQPGYGALAAQAGGAWPSSAGGGQEQAAHVLQYSVTNTVMANGVGNNANSLAHGAIISAPPPAVNSGLPGLSGLALPSLAGVSGPVGGATSLGLHSMAVANSATVLSGTSLTLPSGGLAGELQLSQWPQAGLDGAPGTLGSVLPPSLARPRPLEALDTVPASSLDKLRREVSRLNGEVERLEKEVLRQKGLRESERLEFADAKDRLKHSWAADREDFARVKEQLKRKNAEHHLQNGRLSQALKESEVLARGMREVCLRCNVPLPAELDNPALVARAEVTLTAAARLRAADALIDPLGSSAPASDQQQQQQHADSPLSNGHAMLNGRHHDNAGSISSTEGDQLAQHDAEAHAQGSMSGAEDAGALESLPPPVAPTSVKQAASAVAAMMQQLPAALDGTSAGEDAEHAAATAGTHAQEAAAHGAAAAAAAATALGQLAAALASQAPLPDEGDTAGDTLTELPPPPSPSSQPPVAQPISTQQSPPHEQPSSTVQSAPAAAGASASASASTSASAAVTSMAPSAFLSAADTRSSTPVRLPDPVSSPSDPSAVRHASHAGSVQTEDSAAEAHMRATPFLNLPPLHSIAAGDLSGSPGSSTSTPMSHASTPLARPAPQRLGSGRLSGGVAPPASGYRTRSGALVGPHTSAMDPPPAALNSHGSGSLPGFGMIPGYAPAEPGGAALHMGHAHYMQPSEVVAAAGAPGVMQGFGPSGYAYGDMGSAHAAQAARAMLEDQSLAHVGSVLQPSLPGAFAAPGTGQVSHNQLLNSHGSNFGLAKAPYLYPMQQQALSLAEIEAQLGMNTLPPAAALEGGVLESEMANDENAPWRMPRS